MKLDKVKLGHSPLTDTIFLYRHGKDPKTETNGSQSSNQSGVKSNEKPNCYECKYRRSVPGDAHSECVHPRISETDRIITGFALLAGQRSAAMKRLNVMGDPVGIKRGWFYWPLNYDPTWLETCDGFDKTHNGLGEARAVFARRTRPNC